MRVIAVQVVIDRPPRTVPEAMDELAARLRQEMQSGRPRHPQVAVNVLVADIRRPCTSQV
jgi:hypothetical protein